MNLGIKRILLPPGLAKYSEVSVVYWNILSLDDIVALLWTTAIIILAHLRWAALQVFGDLSDTFFVRKMQLLDGQRHPQDL